MHANRNNRLTCIILAILLGGCAESEMELLTAVEDKVRTDPFLVQFRKDMGRAFGCKLESDPELQLASVYFSLHGRVWNSEGNRERKQYPTVNVDIYCHSAIVQRVYLDINLWRGGVRSFDQFERIEPDMINRIRFEPSDSFAWWISQRRKAPSKQVDVATAAQSALIWTAFAEQVTAMYPQGCDPLDPDEVFFGNESAPRSLPYRKFVAVLGCPQPGPRKPGFNFTGRFYPDKGFVLPDEIKTGGAYVD